MSRAIGAAVKVLIYEHYDYGIHGNQRYLMLLLDRARHLYGDDLDISLVVPSEGVFFRAARSRGRVLALNCRTRPGRFFALWKEMRRLRPDVVVCNNEPSFLSALPGAVLLRRKRVWHVKNLRRSDWSDALCFLFAQRVLTIARRSIEIKSPYLVNRFREKVFVQPIGTALGEYLQIPTVQRGAGPLRLLALIFLSRVKGVDTLVEALEMLDARGVAVEVRVAGVVPAGCEGLAREVKQRTSELDHVQVEWLGWRDDVQSLLRWCQVLVHPSRTDGVPRSIVEASASGRAVIATRVGGIPDAIGDGGEGFLIDAGDAEALVDRILRLAQDGDLLCKMGRAGRDRAQREFDIDHHVERLRAHLEAVAEGG